MDIFGIRDIKANWRRMEEEGKSFSYRVETAAVGIVFGGGIVWMWYRFMEWLWARL